MLASATRYPGSISPQLFAATVSFARNRGMSREEISESSGLSRLEILQQSQSVPDHALRSLWGTLSAREPDQPLALLMGEDTPLSVFGTLAEVATSAPTVYDALELIRKNSTLIATGLSIELDESRSFLSFERSHPACFFDRGSTSNAMTVVFARLLRMLAGTHEVIWSVDLPGERCGATRFEERVSSRVRWSTNATKTRMVLPKELVVRPTYTRNDRVFARGALLLESLRETAELSGSTERLARIVAAVDDALDEGDIRVDAIAKRAGLSVRTIQRTLGSERLTLRTLLDRALLQRCIQTMLSDRRVSASQLATMCGYSDDRAFRRAFRRWTGRSLRAFRTELMS